MITEEFNIGDKVLAMGASNRLVEMIVVAPENPAQPVPSGMVLCEPTTIPEGDVTKERVWLSSDKLIPVVPPKPKPAKPNEKPVKINPTLF